jgi:hypothetical protein
MLKHTKLINEIKLLSKEERKFLFLELRDIVASELGTCTKCSGIGRVYGISCIACKGTGKELLLY